jgi:hypothetical protein
MKFSHQLSYDASPEDVYAMLQEPKFRERVCAAMRSVNYDVSIESHSEGMSVTVDQTQPAKGIPSFAKKFVGDEIRIIQAESWDDPSGATLELEIPGKPGHFKGDISLVADGGGAVETVSGEIRVGLPMIGAKLEGLVANLLKDALDTEQRVGQRWLSGDRG